MSFRRLVLLLCALLCWPLGAQAQETGRALLIGVDEFVSRPSAYPSSTNNVYAMQELFQSSLTPLESLIVPDEAVTTPQRLTELVQDTFQGADEDDVSYLYLSTHGVYDPLSQDPPMLLLSDGTVENGVTPRQLESAFDGIAGTKVIILDACNSGAFIGKGMAVPPEEIAFLGEDFKVLTSSGALEESWYWSAGQDLIGQGAFYFTQALAEGLGSHSAYPADVNRDGAVTLSELYQYLLLNHAASTPQVYPQKDDFVVFRYDLDAPPPQGLNRSPVMDVTFSSTTLSRDMRQITVEFIATRPVRVAYQIVYQREGKWEFDKAQLIYDQAERFAAYGDQPGAVSAGRKLRTVQLGRLAEDSYGYVLVQLVTIDQGKLTVHAGRVICVPPAQGDMHLTAAVKGHPDSGREMSVLVGHDFPCTLSVAVVDENEQVIHRICHRQSTRPMQMVPAGSVFYWDGTLRDGTRIPPGTYRVRVQAHMNDTTVTALSSVFTIY